MNVRPNPYTDFLVRRRLEQKITPRRFAKSQAMTRREARAVIDRVDKGDPYVSDLAVYARAVGTEFRLKIVPNHRCPTPADLFALGLWDQARALVTGRLDRLTR